MRSRSLPARSHPRRRRSKSRRCATGRVGPPAFARVSLGDQSAEAKISRKIIAGQPFPSRFGETLAELPPIGDQVALFRPRLQHHFRGFSGRRALRRILLVAVRSGEGPLIEQ